MPSVVDGVLFSSFSSTVEVSSLYTEEANLSLLKQFCNIIVLYVEIYCGKFCCVFNVYFMSVILFLGRIVFGRVTSSGKMRLKGFRMLQICMIDC
jgi:hypothetical protein